MNEVLDGTMTAPLDGFGQRIVRNNEVKYFINGILDLGISIEAMEAILVERKQRLAQRYNPF